MRQPSELLQSSADIGDLGTGHDRRGGGGGGVEPVVVTGAFDPMTQRDLDLVFPDPHNRRLMILLSQEHSRTGPAVDSESQPACRDRPGRDVGIQFVEHAGRMGGLPTEYRLLGMAVGVESAVPIEVIGGEIGDDGDVGGGLLAVEVFELEAAEFEHDPVVRADRLE